MPYKLPRHILSKTTPIAKHDYECAWDADGVHQIRKGDKYVRVVYKDSDGAFQSDHICSKCWSKL